jgi:hypothetical protein
MSGVGITNLTFRPLAMSLAIENASFSHPFPTVFFDKLFDTRADIVANFSHKKQRERLGIFERPVHHLRTRYEWAVFFAAHRDEHFGAGRHLGFGEQRNRKPR